MALEMEAKALGSVKMKQIPSSTGEKLLGFIQGCVQKGATVSTDGWQGYSNIESNGYPPEIRKMKVNKKALPHVHKIISLLKRWLLGVPSRE
jgi:hypothetical protein